VVSKVRLADVFGQKLVVLPPAATGVIVARVSASQLVEQEGVPLVVLGDFNRRFNIAGDDMRANLDDGDPDLTKYTEGLTSACLNSRVPEYIDHIVTDTRATALARPGSFEQVLFTAVDPGGQAHLSDHCPIAVVFETDGVVEPSDAITVLLDRLDAVQTELEEFRAGIAALQE
jgi:hypothetical protein